jgi:hypothetical protein
VLVVVPTETETSASYAEIAAMLVQFTFLNVLSINTTHLRSQELKKQLVTEYDRENGEFMLLGMVMNIGLPSSVVMLPTFSDMTTMI